MAISKVSGHSVSAAGGILTVVGGALTIATLGAGLPVLIAGVVTGVAGGITRWAPRVSSQTTVTAITRMRPSCLRGPISLLMFT